MRLDELLKGVSAVEVSGPRDREVTGVTQDSRRAREGFVFVAVPGVSGDGWRYASDACERGAIAVVSERGESPGREVCRIRVANAREAAADIACVFHGHPAASMRVAGITGTNGKTTTAWMLRDILRTAGLDPGLIGTVSYEIGSRVIPASRTTPDATELQAMLAQMVKAGCKSVVMEISSHALDQHRTRGIDFDAAVFTNLTRDHLDYHLTREAYFSAKRRLFTGLNPARGRAVINMDDPWGKKLAADPEVPVPVLTFGLCQGADVRGEIRELSSSGSMVVVRGPWGECGMNLRLLGRFNVMNALAAVSCASVLGVAPDVAVRTLSTLTSVRGRMEPVPCNGGFSVFVDYAHTDDALNNVLATLRELKPRRIILVFGCGGNRDRTKRPAMGTIASELADHVILTSDNPRNEEPAEIIREIESGMAGGAGRETVEDRRTAISRAIRMAREGDVVLIAGKGHETFQESAGRKIAFDDRQAASEELRGMGL